MYAANNQHRAESIENYNVNHIIKKMRVYYPSFVRMWESWSSDEREFFKRELRALNNLSIDAVDQGFSDARKQFHGRDYPSADVLVEFCCKKECNATDRPSRATHRYDAIKNETYLVARQELVIRKKQMTDLFHQLKTKHKINGHSFLKLASGSTINDGLMDTYREIQKSIVEEIYPILSHFENRPMSSVTIADLQGKYGA